MNLTPFGKQLVRSDSGDVYVSIITNRWGMYEVGIEKCGKWIVADFQKPQEAFDFIIKHTC